MYAFLVMLKVSDIRCKSYYILISQIFFSLLDSFCITSGNGNFHSCFQKCTGNSQTDSFRATCDIGYFIFHRIHLFIVFYFYKVTEFKTIESFSKEHSTICYSVGICTKSPDFDQQKIHQLRWIFYLSKSKVYSFTFSIIDNSSNCALSMVAGASIITSRPELFLGNAIKSRMVSCPPKIATKRSKPKAKPPCGGAPTWKAFIRKPNCSCACSGVKPKYLNIRAWVSLS